MTGRNPSRRPRALTLVETLAAAALLSLLAAAALPFLALGRTADPAHSPDDLADLSGLADLLAADPSGPVLGIDVAAAGPVRRSVPWPTAPGRDPVSVRWAPSPASAHGWLVLEWRGLTVARFVGRPAVSVGGGVSGVTP